MGNLLCQPTRDRPRPLYNVEGSRELRLDENILSANHDGYILETSRAGPFEDDAILAAAVLNNIGAVPLDYEHTAIEILQSGNPVLLCEKPGGMLDDECAIANRPEPNIGVGGLRPKAKLVYVHIGAQPNNSPHAGTLTVFCLAAACCALIKRHLKERNIDDVEVRLILDLVDTAPDNGEKIERGDGLKYQRSHRATGGHLGFLPDYEELLNLLSTRFDITYTIQNQSDLLKTPGIDKVLRTLLKDPKIASEIAPEKERLALRRACPVPGCGIADKHGIRNNVYFEEHQTLLAFHCPDHGMHTVTLENPEEVVELEMNTPLRNLVRTILYAHDTRRSREDPSCDRERFHIKVTGSDYAGFYQEQLLWRQLARIPGAVPPVVLYAPLITDWAGSKLSKSLYVRSGAYRYMEALNMTRFLSYAQAKETNTDWSPLFSAVEEWLDNPKKLFGSKSVDYMRLLIDGVLSKKDAKGNRVQSSDNQFIVYHDGEVHDPLGAGSYVFEKQLSVALLRYLGLPHCKDIKKATISFHLDVCSPHAPNIVNVILSVLALLLCRNLQAKGIDTCPGVELKPVIELDIALSGITPYQVIQYTGLIRDITKLLGADDIEMHVNFASDLSQSPSFAGVIRRILEDEKRVAAELFPQDKQLGICSICPAHSCDYRATMNNFSLEVENTTIAFECPNHGTFSVNLSLKDEVCKLQFDNPLLDVIRALIYAEDTLSSREAAAQDPDTAAHFHMRITGDGAGFLNEQLLYRQFFLLASDQAKRDAFPVVFYAPPITDWAGSRLSKTAYAEGGYGYMKERGMGYLLSYADMKKDGGSLQRLVEEIKNWVREPKKLFRPFSIEYIHMVASGLKDEEGFMPLVKN